MANERTVDLSNVTAAHLCGELIAHLRDLGAGEVVHVRFAEDPRVALLSADLNLGHRLAWDTQHDALNRWITTVRVRDTASATDVVSLLLADHRRLDGLLAQALTALNAGDADAGPAQFAACAAALVRHIEFEDGHLLPLLAGRIDDPTLALMHREHEEIRVQVVAVDACLSEGAAGRAEAAILCGMLAGTLAKHEHREESLVFPRWRSAVAARDAAFGANLLQEARTRLVR